MRCCKGMALCGVQVWTSAFQCSLKASGVGAHCDGDRSWDLNGADMKKQILANPRTSAALFPSYDQVMNEVYTRAEYAAQLLPGRRL